MILRTVRGRVQAEDRDRVVQYIREDVLDGAGLPGMTSFQPAIREGEDGLEFLVVSTWSDLDAILATGAVRNSVVAVPRMMQILREPRAEHWELVSHAATSLPVEQAILRLSTVTLDPLRAAAFYERVRSLWDALVAGAGLLAVVVGRRVDPRGESAIVVSVWDGPESLAAATSEGFVGGASMAQFYTSVPQIEHFDALPIARPLGEAVPLVLQRPT